MPPPLGFTSARVPLVNRAGSLEHLDTDGFQHVPAALGVPAGYVLASGGPGVRPAWTPLSGVSVASVFGRTGAVVATSTDYAAFYQPLNAKLTNFAALANASGVLTNDGAGNLSWTAAGGGGTVTSVGLAMPSSLFDVTGSPVSTSGTLTASFKSQAAGLFLASPAASTGVPSMRAIVSSDLPGTIAANTTGSAATLTVARTLTIGGTGKTFNGSSNVAWSLAEIGAMPAVSGGTTALFLRGDGTWSNTLAGSGAYLVVHNAVISNDAGNNWVVHNAATASWGHAFQSNGTNLLTLMPGGASFASLTAGGIVKADPSTGMLKIATSGDLPFLPASGGSTNRLAKWASSSALGYGIVTDDGDVVYADPGSASGGRFRSRYAGAKATFIGNSNHPTDYWGMGSDGTSSAVLRFGNCDVAGTFNTDPLAVKITGSLEVSNLSSGGLVRASASTGLLQIASSGDITGAITSPTFTGGSGFDFLASTAMSSALIRIGDGATTHAVSFPKIATKSFSVAGTAEFADIVTSTKVTAGRVSMTQTGFAITDAITVPDAGADKSWTFSCETILNKVKSFTFDGVGNFDISAAPVQKLRFIVVTAGSYELPVVAQGESVQIIFNVSACDVSTNSTQSTTALGSPYGTSSAVGTYGHGAGSNRRSSILLTGVSSTRSSIIA